MLMVTRKMLLKETDMEHVIVLKRGFLKRKLKKSNLNNLESSEHKSVFVERC
jgi:hypothetical protein